jgi:periplasmic divalent cation tolerance protein
MSSSPDHVVALCTVPSDEDGARIASALVEARLAACVSLVPGLRSIYVWDGEVCDDAETLLLAKTRAERFEELSRRIVELHPYDVPEVIALPVSDGHGPYLSLIDEVVAR